MTREATRSPLEPSGDELHAFDELLAQIAEAPAVPTGSLLRPGTEVGGFRVCERIGRGAFGTVYRAVHPLIGKEVAIKLLSRAHAGDANLVRRFVEEARAVSRLHHPNIVDIFGFGELHDGTPYYVMELLKGKTLSALLRDREVLRLDCALAILIEVASALDAAHAAGILHRDLKPPNVFVTGDIDGDFQIKLLDFGVAKFMDGSTQTTAAGMVIGTPAYMSPEQCAAEPLAATSDVYALGVLAFELLTGELPFADESNARVLVRHLVDVPPRVSTVANQLPRALDAPVAAMLEKQPAKRPQSAREAVEVFRKVLSDIRSGGQGISRARAEGSWPGHAARWALTGAFVVLAVAMAVWVQGSPAAPRAEAVAPMAAPFAPAPKPPDRPTPERSSGVVDVPLAAEAPQRGSASVTPATHRYETAQARVPPQLEDRLPKKQGKKPARKKPGLRGELEF